MFLGVLYPFSPAAPRLLAGPAAPAPEVSLVARSDTFDRADSSSVLGTPSDAGSAWQVLGGTWGISTNRGYNPSATEHGMAVLESGLADVDVQVTSANTSQGASLWCRVSNASNGILAGFIAGNWRMYTLIGGGFTELQTAAGSCPTGTVLKLRANGDQVTLFANGVAVLGPNTTTFNQTATKHGLGSYVTSVFTYDDFTIAAIAVGPVVLSPAGIASGEAFGTPTASPGAVALAPPGIASGEAFGVPTVAPGAAGLSPAGIASGEAFGSPTISAGAVVLVPSGIASGEAFGSPSLSAGSGTVSPAGIASGEAFGSPALAAGVVVLSPSGIASAEAFGDPTLAGLAPGAQSIAPAGIDTAEAFGSPTLTPGAVLLAPPSIGSAETFGTPTLVAGAVIVPEGIASGEAFGTPALAAGMVAISPAGIASREAFGTPSAYHGAVPPAYTEIRLALVQYLLADEELGAIVDDRVRNGNRDRDDGSRPALTFLLLSSSTSTSGITLSGTPGNTRARIRFDCWASLQADCLAIKGRLEELFDGRIRPMSGLDVRDASKENEADAPLPIDDGTGEDLYLISAVYNFVYQPLS